MSKAFNFSLQKVLDVRKHAEDQRSIELNNSQRKLQKDQQKLNQLNNNKQKVLKNDSHKSASPVEISLMEIKVTNQYIEQINNEIVLQKAQIQRSSKKVEKNRKELLDAVKDKKVVELLKDRYSEKYKKMKNLEAAKNENEIAIRLSLRNKDKS
jgi:flagellar FliJ protein